jgi:glycine cleavage system H protein
MIFPIRYDEERRIIMTVLFVIVTIIVFLTIDWILQRRQQRVTQVAVPETPSIQTLAVRLPEGIFFAPSHTWLNLFPSGKIRLGVDDFISGLLKHPEIRLLKHQGEQIRKGDPLIALKEQDHLLTIRSPIDGHILAANDELPLNPKLLNEQPFSDGWAYMIKPLKLSELKQMLIGAETQSWIKREFHRLRDLLAGVGRNGSLQPAYLQEGGPPIAGLLSEMDDVVWHQIDQEFLHVL